MEAQQTQSVQQGIKKEGFHITVTQMCITAVFMALTCVATWWYRFLFLWDMHIWETA